MRKIIHRMRQQSEQVRRQILHVLVAVAGIILVSLWVYSLGTNFTDPDMQAKIDNDLKPFEALKDNLTAGYQNISQ